MKQTMLIIMLCLFVFTGCQNQNTVPNIIPADSKNDVKIGEPSESSESTALTEFKEIEIAAHEILNCIIKKGSGEKPEDVVYYFDDSMEWNDFKLKYLKDITIPNLVPEDYDKAIICLFNHPARPYKVPIISLKGIFREEDKIIIRQDHTGVVEELDDCPTAIQMILLTVNLSDFPKDLPIHIHITK